MLTYSNINNKSNILIKKFKDERPKDNVEYFTKREPKGEISVIIPFYNEEANELKVTLKSLYNAYDYLCEMKEEWRDKQLNIVIIQDGWYKASESMKEYLLTLFEKKVNGDNWNKRYTEFSEYDVNKDGSTTFVFENNLDYTCINPEEKYKHHKLFLNITLVVKIDNRRKHNSHEWFLANSGFAQSKNAKYLFFTDAFTLYNTTCLYHLVETLDNNEQYSAATGRQRVMSRDQQGTFESTLSLGYLLRMVQMFDFELANAVYNGAFSLGGCLPVIPGPCGLYRGSDVLQDAVRDWYFNVVSVDPDETGLVLGNLKIAEDRILTYSSVLKTKDVKYMAFVSLSVFYFEAELSLERLILQRRRWINGSIAGYIYLLFTDSKHLLEWKTNTFRKLYILFLLFCQFIIYCSVAIAPAYSLRMVYYSTDYLLSKLGYQNIEAIILTTLAVVVYIAHIVIHSKKKFQFFIMHLLLLLSFVTSILSITAIIYYVFIDYQGSLFELLGEGTIVLYVVLFVFFGPFILSLLLSSRGHSLMNMLKAFIPYLLFLHMMISWFGSYAYARVWDLTWGNRPQGDTKSKDIDNIKKKYILQSRNITLCIFIANIVVFFLPRTVQLIILSIFFFCAAIQMVFSIIYLFIQIPKKLTYVWLKMKKCFKKVANEINLKRKKELRKEVEEEMKNNKDVELEVENIDIEKK